MPKVGDRVIIEASKVGQQRREGTLIGTVGPLINVRWADGSVSLFKPGAGSVSFEGGRDKAAPNGKLRAAKTSTASKAKAASKKVAPKKAAPKPKAAAKKAAAKPKAKKPASKPKKKR